MSAREEWRKAWRWVRWSYADDERQEPPRPGDDAFAAVHCYEAREDGIDAVERIAIQRRYALDWAECAWSPDRHRRYCREVLA